MTTPMCPVPIAREVTAVDNGTTLGVDCDVHFPYPNWPLPPSPHVNNNLAGLEFGFGARSGEGSGRPKVPLIARIRVPLRVQFCHYTTGKPNPNPNPSLGGH